MNIVSAKEMNIPIVEDRHYWFVRTTGGDHYSDFVGNNYIAIGWDYVSIGFFHGNNEESVKHLIDINEKNELQADDSAEDEIQTPKQTITAIYNKISRFVDQFKIGDIVLVPSKNSDNLAIGTVASEVFENSAYAQTFFIDNPESETIPCPYHKRRRVNWIKFITKAEVDVYLSKALSAHHSISNIDDCASLINRSIHNVYATEKDIHAIIRSERSDGLSLGELRDLIDCIDCALAMSATAVGEEYDANSISAKVVIHSPGLIEICGLLMGSGMTIAMLIYAISHYRHGGKAKGSFSAKIAGQEFSYEYDHESKGELDYKADRKKLDAHILDRLVNLQDKLQIEFPELDASAEYSDSEPEK